MTTEEFIITLFCEIDDRMGDMPKHPQAQLWPSELVTIGLLFALKGGYFRAFYRWFGAGLWPVVWRPAPLHPSVAAVGESCRLV